MTFAQKIRDFFHCKKKENKIRAQNELSATRLAKGMETAAAKVPRLDTKEQTLDIPTAPPRALLRESTSFAGHRATQSLMAYGQADLTNIDRVPRPHWGSGLSEARIRESQSRVKTHYRYEKLEKRGIKAPTLLVGPKRMDALEAYEELEEKAANGLKDCLAAAQSQMKGERTTEAPSDKNQGMAVGKGRLGSARSAVPRVNLFLRPVKTPLSMGFRRWLREGVDRGLQPHAVGAHLYGRDKRGGSKRTVFPREWETTLVTSAERPRAIPHEYYQQFAREM
ncbi:hypothetical protein TWF788_009666 [Orbilia oligospora]|uniref:Uncharacterized protein n=1 Tax=Orbilia oligospora TaxID=2813651 RepID=A0A7C8PQ64_ORBOL|nr:hypothetical protein TWF788_009666 [Orbilia oligospora]